MMRDRLWRINNLGATSSPVVATYGLRKLGLDYKDSFPEAAKFVRRNFYIDNDITSVITTKDGDIYLITGATS